MSVARALSERYGIETRSIEYVTLGLDPYALTWVVAGAAGTYFVKAKRGVDRVRLDVTKHLSKAGLDAVVAPIPASDGRLAATLGPFDLVVYPFVEGVPAITTGLTERQWIDYGQFVGSLHAVRLPRRLGAGLGRETFGGDSAGQVRALDRTVAEYRGDDPARLELAELWLARRSEILGLVERAETDRARVLARDKLPELVLCHSDIHLGNLLVGADGGLHVVDWDDVLMAPRERDLKFALPGRIGSVTIRPGDTDLFMQGYGDYAVDQHLLSWYRDQWVVVDIAEFALTAFVQDVGPATRASAIEGFRGLFE